MRVVVSTSALQTATTKLRADPLARRCLRVWQCMDARWFQIVFLLSFLLVGAWARDFALRPLQVLLAVGAAVLTQAAWQWALDLPTKTQWGGYLSALVTSLGLSILVRAESDWVHPLLALLAISSKYLIRLGPPSCKSHVLNPANFAAFLAWAWMPGAWLSPAQWGSESLLALWFIALGGLVTQRIQRRGVSLAFLSAWGVLLAARLLWLGYTWNPGAAMWLQQISSGAVLLFAFFMVSDPMTTPQHPRARMAYALLVALAAFVWQYVWYQPHGLIGMLFVCSWTVPLWNQAWPRPRFAWEGTAPVRNSPA